MRAERVVVSAEAIPASARKLMEGIVDYAGMFPPAGLAMAEAAGNYAAYRAESDSWALGRFVTPAGRLVDLDRLAERLGGRAWPVSALVGADVAADLERVGATGDGNLTVESIEVKASTIGDVGAVADRVPPGTAVYVEIPLDPDPADLLGAIAAAGLRAKARTGGVTRDAFPPVRHLARFIRACTEGAVPFKATAGLHHPLAGDYPLTYQPGCDTGRMYGFLTVLLAAGLARRDAGESEVAEALLESDPDHFALDEQGFSWQAERFTLDEIGALREHGMVSFGSCSFEEPVDGLRSLIANGGVSS